MKRRRSRANQGGASTEHWSAGRLVRVPRKPLQASWTLGLIVLVGVIGAVGLGFAAAGERATGRLHEDERDFVSAATHLMRHGVLAFSAPTGDPPAPSAYREPAYPALLAVAWRIAGFSPPAETAASARMPADPTAWRPVVALNLTLLAIAALAVGCGVASLAGIRGGSLAFLFVAWSPALQANVGKAMAENLAAAHFSLAGVCLLALARRERWARLAALAILGLLPLTRAEGLVLLPVALLVDRLAAARRPAAAGRGAVALLALGLATPSALWTARNAAQLGHPVLADRGGLALAVRAELDADVARFGASGAMLAWTPLAAAQRQARRTAPAATWLEFRPLGPGNYYFRTLRRWQEERRIPGADSLAVDATFRRAALRSFVSQPWAHLRAAAAVAWRGLFAETSPRFARPFDFSFVFGLVLAAAMCLATGRALARGQWAALALLAPAWSVFAFHVGVSEFLPRYAVPLLPLVWAALALVLADHRGAPAAPEHDLKLRD